MIPIQNMELVMLEMCMELILPIILIQFLMMVLNKKYQII